MSASPHDALFKAVYGELAHARGALQTALPAVIAEAIDWTQLARQPGSFVDPVMRGRHTDLLFSAAWATGGDTLLYVLFEHQSSLDAQMAFRLVRYMVRIWERWRADHPGAGKLPAIIPLVLYHGATAWSVPRSFGALLDVPDTLRPALAPHLIQLTYLVEDLSEIPDAELQARDRVTALARLAALCFKHARTHTNLVAMLRRWVELLREIAGTASGLEALERVMRYILLVNDHLDRDALHVFLDHEVSHEAKDIVMTVGERLIEQGKLQGIQQGVQQGIQQGVQQGIQQGVQQGIQQGVQQGIQQGVQQLFLTLLRQRFGDAVTAETEQRLLAAPVEQIDAWSKRLFSATTLAELLG